MKTLKVLVDTREQAPWQFKGMRLSRATLAIGDYCLAGDRTGLVIERKSAEDLFGTVTKGAARFWNELDKLGRLCDYPVVVVEATAETIKHGARFSGANGSRVLDHALKLCVGCRVSIMFCEGRFGAEDIAMRLLAAREKTRHEKSKA